LIRFQTDNPLQTAALREAIKEYEANKWKVIGQKLGKPAKVHPRLCDFAYYYFY
jgi:hypothetical protein